MRLADTLGWYANRARSMPPREVAHRLREQARRARSSRTTPADAIALRPVLDVRPIREAYLSDELVAADVAKALDGRAVRLMGVEVDLLALRWHDNPDGTTWSREHWTSVPFRRSGHDPKFVWEVNRLGYLLPLWLGSRPADRDAASELVLSVLESWAADTQPARGIAWTSGIEVALRTLSLTLLAASDLALPTELRVRIRTECAHGVAYLRDFPSLFSSANNHRVAELVARLVVEEAWLAPGDCSPLESELADVAESLFGRDGGPREQSPTYGAFTLELLLLCLRLHRWTDCSSRSRVDLVARRAIEFLDAFSEPGTGILRYGDDDEGRVLGVLLAEGSWLGVLHHLAGTRRGQHLPGLRTFGEAGASVVRTHGGGVLTLLHGELGFGQLAAHGHLDQLHLSLYLDGSAWLVDPGTYQYHAAGHWRDDFRSAELHNGPRVAGDPVAIPTGAFNWHPRRPVSQLLSTTSTGADHTLRASRTSAVTGHDVFREVQLRGVDGLESLTVRDVASRPEVVVSSFAFHPACSLERSDEKAWTIRRLGTDRVMTFAVMSGRPTVSTSWFSAGYAQKEECLVIHVESESPGASLICGFTLDHDERKADR